MGRLLLLLFSIALPLFAEVEALYLSWYDNPTTTMTVQWISPEKHETKDLYLEEGGKFVRVTSTKKSIDGYVVFNSTIDRLKPDTEYRFELENEIYKFKTAPKNLDRPLRFAIGGDMYERKKLFRKMAKVIREKDPLFFVIGGDIAYAIDASLFRHKRKSLKRWISFLKEWQEEMITKEKRVIPFLLVPGNHDIKPDNYELFFTLFAYPERQLYRTVDFGDYLSLILLDTGHFQPIRGRQSAWLKKALKTHENTPYRFVIYHEGAYPSFYPYYGAVPKMIRTYWCPLFDEYGITAAFEHHNHAFKRTYPLKGNRIDEEGIIYFGDGGVGANPRRTNDMWYLEERVRKNSFYLIDLTKEEAKVEAFGLKGEKLLEIDFSPL